MSCPPSCLFPRLVPFTFPQKLTYELYTLSLVRLSIPPLGQGALAAHVDSTWHTPVWFQQDPGVRQELSLPTGLPEIL